MGDHRVLRLHSKNNKFMDMEVEVDRCTIMDLFIDMYKLPKPLSSYILPTHPYVTYHAFVNGEWMNKPVTTDNELMGMFEECRNQRLIDLWLTSSREPCEALVLARRVMRGGGAQPSTQKTALSSPPSPPVAPSGLTSPTPSSREAGDPQKSQSIKKVFPRGYWAAQSPPKKQKKITTTLGADRIPPSLEPPHQTQQDEQASSHQYNQPVQALPPLNNEVVDVSQCTALALYKGKKIPGTSARRLGIETRRMSTSMSKQPSSGRSVRSKVSSSPTPIDSTFNEAYQSEEEDDNYVPTEGESGHDDDVVSTDADMVEENDRGDVGEEFIIRDHFDLNPESIAWDDEDDSLLAKIYQNGVLYEGTESESIELQPWQIFTDKEHFWDVLTDFCVQEGVAVITIKSDPTRLTVECASEGCQWRLHSSRLVDGISWAIKNITGGEHTCPRLHDYNPMANVDWAARQVLEDVRANPELPPSVLNNLLFERFGIKLKKSSMYKMREVAVKTVQGGHDASYALLPAYCDMVRSTNPGSYANCVWRVSQVVAPERPLVFNNLFIALHACVAGVSRGIRPLIGVDGTHLKGNYGGVLLTACLLDGNNEIFPLAYSIVSGETTDTWRNFFAHLKNVLTSTGIPEWTIISDRQKGVEPALDDVWPEAKRRFCCRHLCMNFRKSYHGPLLYTLYWRIVNAYSDFVFKKAMEKANEALQRIEAAMEKSKKSAEKEGSTRKKKMTVQEWLESQGPVECWSRHRFDPNVCSDSNTSNFVESFNAQLGVERSKPILTLLEHIRRMCMVRHSTRRDESDAWDPKGLTPYAKDLLEKANKDSRSCKVYKSSGGVFEIKDGHSCLTVSVENRTCLCGVWQVRGIPCKHGVRALNYMRASLKDYVSPFYTVKAYKSVYESSINPIPDSEQWPPLQYPKISPPSMKRGIGRPSRSRKREAGEKRKGKRSTTVRCGKCKQLGHNGRTCKGGLTKKEIRIASREGTSTIVGGVEASLDTNVNEPVGVEGGVMSSAPWIQTPPNSQG